MLTTIATAYGRPALEALRTAVAGVKVDDPMAPVTVLAPSQVAATVARRHLARHGAHHEQGAGIAGIDVTTTARLAERLAAPVLAPRRPHTGPLLTAAWRSALQVDPGVFAEVAAHPATLRALVAAHRELRTLSDGDLDAIAGGSTVAHDLVRLHRGVQAKLVTQWYDSRDLLDVAEQHLDALRPGHPVILYLPQDLTVPEQHFVTALGSRASLTVLDGRTGVARADARRRAAVLAQEEMSAGVTVPTASALLNASDSDDEVRCVVRDVVSALEHTPADRVAVLYGAREPYARLLHEHLAAAGIRVTGPGPRPVVERAVSRAVLGLLALADDDVSRGPLFRALADAPVLDLKGSLVPVARWERVSREAGVLRGEDWERRLRRFADAEQARAAAALTDDRPVAHAAALRRADTATELREFVARLRAELDAASAMESWTDLSRWAVEFIELLFDDLTRLPAEEQHAATAVLSVLRGLPVLDDVEGAATMAGLRQTLESELADSLPRVGRFGDGVFVAPVAQAVGLDLDVVHVVGLSEDLYPGRPRTDSLLPDQIRTIAGLPTAQDRLNRQYRHLLAAFSAAPVSTASFPRGDLRRSSHRLPSRWLLGTMRELSRDNRLTATRWNEVGDLEGALRTSGSFAGELQRTPNLATEQEWRTRAALAGVLVDPVVNAARDMTRARAGNLFTRFDGDLRGLEGLPDYRVGDRLVSPTALEQYASCPHTFFVSRLLGVAPLEQPEDLVTISPADLGTLVHRCLDELVQLYAEELPGPGEPWPDDARTRLIEILHRLADDAETDGLTGHPKLWRRERDRLEADLLGMLDADDEWRASMQAGVVASEMPFGVGEHRAVDIPVPGGTVRLRGSADKVDIAADGTIYVTDVKTGSRRAAEGITPENPLADASKLQLPVYGVAARQRFGQPDTSVRAGYWFVRKEPGRVDLEITSEVHDELSRALDVLSRSIADGLFPQRPPKDADFAWVQCPYCNPDGIGHSTNRERWERQRHDSPLRELVRLLEPGSLADTEEDQ
ncbi:PD-(D/E)XK nuclease family protein [Cellulomonas sp. Y8]|uniref:PD-(D/E)XK nuclease family protein n=1 Tax=Cellulomonas sp. Y8 TaxID=2591145 RepID=UPI003D7420E4